MEEGPTSGVTVIPFLCAIDTISAPGSAIPGQPASDITPTFSPSRHGFKKVGSNVMSVNLFRVSIFKLP
jgi:hypothetical protein